MLIQIPVGVCQFGRSSSTKAVIIGISDYEDSKISDLQFADRDAEAFARFLLDIYPGKVVPQDITLLTNSNATGGQVHNALNRVLNDAEAGQTIIFFFSGHGDVEVESDVEEGHLLLYDTPSNNYKINSLRLEDLKRISNQLTLEVEAEVILVTDACRSGSLAGEVIQGTQLTAADLARQFGKETKIMSCQPNEFSLEGARWGGGHGLFTYHLIDGLTGLADQNNDLQVSLREIQRYLEDWIEQEAEPHSQSPSVQGNKNKVVSLVDESHLDSLIQNKITDSTTPLAALSSIIEKGIEFTNPVINSKLDSFYQALADEYYLPLDQMQKEGRVEGGSASELFDQIISSGISESQIKGAKGDFVAALQDDAQKALNAYLQSDNDELLEREINSGAKYSLYPSYLEKAISLIGPSHYLYSQLLAKKLYFKAVNLRIANRYNKYLSTSCEQGIELINEALLYEDRAAYLYNEMGLLLGLLSDPAAIEMFKRASELSPQWARAYCNLAYQFYRKEEYEIAEEWAGQAVRIDPEYNRAVDILAKIYSMTGRFDEANSLLSDFINNYGPDYWIYYQLGLLHADYNKPTRAKALFTLSNETVENFNAHFSLAYMTPFSEPNVQQYHYERALSFRPTSIEALNNLGWLYQDTYENMDMALKCYERVVEIDPYMLNPNLNMGRINFSRNKIEKAKEYFTHVIQSIDKENAIAHFFLAQISGVQGNHEECLSYLKNAIEYGYRDHKSIFGSQGFKIIQDDQRFIDLINQID